MGVPMCEAATKGHAGPDLGARGRSAWPVPMMPPVAEVNHTVAPDRGGVNGHGEKKPRRALVSLVHQRLGLVPATPTAARPGIAITAPGRETSLVTIFEAKDMTTLNPALGSPPLVGISASKSSVKNSPPTANSHAVRSVNTIRVAFAGDAASASAIEMLNASARVRKDLTIPSPFCLPQDIPTFSLGAFWGTWSTHKAARPTKAWLGSVWRRERPFLR